MKAQKRYPTFQAVFFVALTLYFSVAKSFGQTPDIAQVGGILVNGGGGVRGVVQTSVSDIPDICEIEPALGGKIVVDSTEVQTTSVLRPEQISYRKFAPLEKDSVESQLKIARWASSQKLSAIADEHYERVIELDHENEEAHKALRHVKSNGMWLSNKEKMERNGLERVNGKNVTSQEAELIRKQKENEEAARYWKKEILFLYRQALNGDLRSKEAFRSIRNPQALSPLLKLFESETKNSGGRILLIQAISSIGNPASLNELGKIAINDPDLDVRIAAVDGICRKKVAVSDAVEYFRRRLRNATDVASINRAAYALGRLCGEGAIPDLINALVTVHKSKVITGSDQTGMTVDNTGKISGFNPGGGTRAKVISQVSENEAVHDALVEIVKTHYATPVDFGYDVGAWIRWRHEVEQLADFYPRRDR